MVCGLAAVLSAVATAEQPAIAPDVEDEYELAVSWLAAGRGDEALGRLASWPEDRLSAGVRRLTGSRTWSDPSQRTDVIEAAALLHTAAWMATLAANDLARSALHLDLARTLLGHLPPVADEVGLPPASVWRFTRRDWEVVVIEKMVALAQPQQARAAVQRLLDRFPADPEILLVAGTVEEALYFEAAWAALARAGGASSLSSAVPFRRAAEARYRAALERAPDLSEARVRLARILGDRGRLDEARGVIAPAMDAGGPPHLQCLANLVLGALRERAGEYGEAEQAYRAAVAAQPEGQSARVALAALLLRMGRATEVPTALGSLLDPREPSGAFDDAWWRYPFGRLDHADSWLVAWQQQVTRR